MKSTTQQAAESIREHAGTMRHKAWQALVRFGPLSRASKEVRELAQGELD